MLRGTLIFICDNCGHKFKALMMILISLIELSTKIFGGIKIELVIMMSFTMPRAISLRIV